MLVRLIGADSPFLRDLGALVLRLGAGGTMLFAHGLGKLTHFGEYSAGFPDPLGVTPAASLGLVIFSEVFCALLVLLGAVTRLALIPLIVTMGVAHLMIHGADPWEKRELSFLYLMAYLVLFLVGPGRFSVDGLLLGGKPRIR